MTPAYSVQGQAFEGRQVAEKTPTTSVGAYGGTNREDMLHAIGRKKFCKIEKMT